jgi:thiol-disulfide isomerase/thioredoxin
LGVLCLHSDAEPRAVPEFPKDAQWLQTKPLSLSALRGQVVVVHFWTRGCSNCQANYPVYKRWQEQYADKPVKIIGVHTPEFDSEADTPGVQRTLEKQGLKYPVVIDNDRQIWKSWQNEYWPCIYLVDKKGRVRYHWDGELHLNSADDRRFAAHIDELLGEAP